MQVIFSAGVKVGGLGIGDTSFHGAKALDEKNYLKRLVCCVYAAQGIRMAEIRQIPVFGNVVDKFPNHYLKNSFYDLFASFYVDDCDMFHVWTGQGLCCIKKAKKHEAITVVERGNSHPTFQEKLLKEEYAKFGQEWKHWFELLNKRMLKEFEICDYINVPSTFCAETFIKNGFDENKLLVLPLGADVNKFKPAEKNEKFKVVSTGQIFLRKGIPYLLEAWEKLNLKNAELVLIGNVYDEIRHILKKYAANKTIRIIDGGVQDNIHEIATSSVAVFPSIEDGFAITVVEAMACGCPVIVSENTGAKDIVTKEIGFVIPIRSSKAIADKIRYFYDNGKQAEKMGKAARKQAEKYSWERYEKESVKLLEKLV
jgi:glycosyltransferase involved in cell wall biosynthesis